MAEPQYPSEWHAALAELANHIAETIADHPENGGNGHHVMPGSYTGQHAARHKEYHAKRMPTEQTAPNALFAAQQPQTPIAEQPAEASTDDKGHWHYQPRDGGRFSGAPSKHYYEGREE